jgi:hypothetical protein
MIIVERLSDGEKQSTRFYFEYADGVLLLTRYIEAVRTNRIQQRYNPLKDYKTPEKLATVEIPKDVAFDAAKQLIMQTVIKASHNSPPVLHNGCFERLYNVIG